MPADRWVDGEAAGRNDLDLLVYRSNLLGRDSSIVNYGGGNTSAKLSGVDHLGREVEVLWIKGSGSDLATIDRDGFTPLRLDDVREARKRDAMPDEDMVEYLAHCSLDPGAPRPSIETMLHAFLPFAHVDHTHPEAAIAFCCSESGPELTHECFGEEIVWVPYVRPGFALGKLAHEALESSPNAIGMFLARHGLVTWGDTGRESYRRTIDVLSRAGAWLERNVDAATLFGGQRIEPAPVDVRRKVMAGLLPDIRGELSRRLGANGRVILHWDDAPEVMRFVCSRNLSVLARTGAACPDHVMYTKFQPLVIDESVQGSKFKVQSSAFNVQRSTFNDERASAHLTDAPFAHDSHTEGVQVSTFEVQRTASTQPASGSFPDDLDDEGVQGSTFKVQRNAPTQPGGGSFADDPYECADLVQAVRDAVASYVERYRAFFEAHAVAGDEMFDPAPRVILIPGLGMVTASRDAWTAANAAALYRTAIRVMRWASSNGGFVSLTPQEAWEVEYWPLELYKLTLLPPNQDLTGHVAVITGGAGGIGLATAKRLLEEGAHVVIADLDSTHPQTVAAELGALSHKTRQMFRTGEPVEAALVPAHDVPRTPAVDSRQDSSPEALSPPSRTPPDTSPRGEPVGAALVAAHDVPRALAVDSRPNSSDHEHRHDRALRALGVSADASAEADVDRMIDEAVLAYGGVDIVIPNAGVSSAGPIEETEPAEWERVHGLMVRGYFLTCRAAFIVMKRQGLGGSIVINGSKNGLAAGKNAIAYTTAKAAEHHMARCLAEEGGPDGIRVNTVAPDAVIRGSGIWTQEWIDQRARAYGFEAEDAEEYYRQRNALRVTITAEDVAEAILFLASKRSAKTTGCIITVDGGLAVAYPR